MELYRDLLIINKKSRIQNILATLLIVLAIGWIFLRIYEAHHISLFDWLNVTVMVLNGLFVGGIGNPILKLFGKAFILINEDEIRIKMGVFEKEQSVFWNNIKSIDYELYRFKVNKLDATYITLKLPGIESSFKENIKDVVRSIAKGKGITTSF